MSQMLELKDTKKNKTHNIQPQHALGGTRVSGSFSNLSVSSGTYSGTSRRRGTVAAGRYEHVSMPRTSARYGRDGTRPGSRRRSLVLPRGDVELRLFGSLATSSRLLTSTTEQRLHSKRLEALSDVPSSSDRLDYTNSVVDCSVRTQMSNCTVR